MTGARKREGDTSLLEGTHYRLHKGKERLYELWERWNEDYFEGALLRPEINLTEPSNPRRLADCGTRPVFVGDRWKTVIRIRPSLLAGTFTPALTRGSGSVKGQLLMAEDVLLHEMVHQWQYEVLHRPEESYHGHGTAFRNKANEIGAKLGLPRVRSNRTDGKDRALPLCSHWPHVVRPAAYYLGVYVPTSGDKPEEDRSAMCEDAAHRLARRFSVEEIRTIAAMAEAEALGARA